ncbi:MAG TPA: nitroreductase/quinone reductase family protein [Candidatus Acidoferrum sp.]|nr:nitroreductase/quinone reductase family protein [Candidatus Acidoferrum sp.]
MGLNKPVTSGAADVGIAPENYKRESAGSIPPTPSARLRAGSCKKRKDGAPSVELAHTGSFKLGRPPITEFQMSNQSARKDALRDRLARSQEINISVTGRKSGRTISIPIWFVLEGDTLNLLPVKGSNTQWYKNVVKNPSFGIEAGGAVGELKAVPVTDAKQVKSVVEKFREKYGVSDVKKYYAKFDVAVVAKIP